VWDFIAQSNEILTGTFAVDSTAENTVSVIASPAITPTKGERGDPNHHEDDKGVSEKEPIFYSFPQNHQNPLLVTRLNVQPLLNT
jgi:hypothetical protein